MFAFLHLRKIVLVCIPYMVILILSYDYLLFLLAVSSLEV